MKGNLLIAYSTQCAEYGHVDPNFTQLVYGCGGQGAMQIKECLEPGSYIFFNARIGGKRYITAYFYVEKILMKGKNDMEISALNCSAKDDDIIIIGSRCFSKVLTIPLLLDKGLLMKLKHCKFDEEGPKNRSMAGFGETKGISEAAASPILIGEDEKEMLIYLCRNRG